jgi:hypothetical protein
VTATPEQNKAFSKLLRKISTMRRPHGPDTVDPISVIVHSFLLWDCPAEKAMAGYQRLADGVVDFNELRINLPPETAAMLGTRYPRLEERCLRLRGVLNDIYRREHAVTLERVRTQNKKDIKRFIETLDGIVPFVAARLGLVCFELHGIPADERLRTELSKVGIVSPTIDLMELSSWLAHHVKADDALKVHEHLVAWVDSREGRSAKREAAVAPRSARKPAKKPAKKTTHRPAARKSTGRTGGGAAGKSRRAASAR